MRSLGTDITFEAMQLAHQFSSQVRDWIWVLNFFHQAVQQGGISGQDWSPVLVGWTRCGQQQKPLLIQGGRAWYRGDVEPKRQAVGEQRKPLSFSKADAMAVAGAFCLLFCSLLV